MLLTMVLSCVCSNWGTQGGWDIAQGWMWDTGRACEDGKDWRQKNGGFGASGSQAKKRRTPSRREQHPPLQRGPVQCTVLVSDFIIDAQGSSGVWGRGWYQESGPLLPALPLVIMDEIGAKNPEEVSPIPTATAKK